MPLLRSVETHSWKDLTKTYLGICNFCEILVYKKILIINRKSEAVVISLKGCEKQGYYIPYPLDGNMVYG